MAEALDHLKKDYRARFCHGGGERIDLQQSQNLMKLIQDCFESGNSDLKTNSPSCSTLILKNEEGTSVQSQRPKPESASSVKRARKSADPSPASLLKPVSSRGHSCESHLKPATHDQVAASKKPESSVSKSEKKSTIKDEALCQHPAVLLGSEDNRESARSPFPVEEVKNSPVVKLHFDNWSMPDTAESHAEVENFEGPQPGRDEKVVPVQGAECFVTSSAQSEKPFSSAVLATVATRTLGQRYSTSISPPSPCPVKHQDIEIEDECEFLIDESSGASSWISIPTKNKKSKSDGSAIPISKSQPSEKEKTQNKEIKNRKVQVKAHTKQKLDHLDVGTFDFKEMSESDPIPESEENVLTSQSQKSTCMGKTKKDALRQDSPNQKKSGLETKPCYEEQCKTRMLPSEDLPMPSCGHQEEQTVSLKKSLRSSKNQQLASKASQDLDEKEQTAKQKLPKVEVAKRRTVSPRKKPKKSVQQSSSKKRQLQREELSDSESSEEELEKEPIKLNKVCTTPLHQELETPVIEKLTKSLDKKEQTTKQKLPKVEVAKRGTVSPRKKPKKSVQQSSSKKRQLQREELSDSESSEEELEREPIKLNKVCTTPLHQELETPVIEKLTKSLDKKEQTTKQKLPKVQVAKRGTVSPRRKKPKKSVQQSSSKKRQLQREELSDSESSEEELEREPIKLNKVCTTPLHQKLETPVIQKLTKSKKRGNVLHALESPVGANTATPLEALQHPMESVKNPEKKRLSAKSSEKIPCKIPCRASKALCSSSEDTGSQTDTDSSSVQDMPRKKPKLPDVKIRSSKRKHNRQHGPQDSFVAEKAVSCKSGLALEDYDKFACSGPALEDYDKFASSTESPGQDDTSSDNSEDLNYKLRHLLSDEIARHKIVMPSNTPNVRRTKRIRLRPLEYWRGERINYTMDSSGGLVISGIVHPETESPRKSKMRKKDHPKQERDETSRRETPASLEHGFFVSSDRREILAGLEHSFFVSSDRREIPAGLEHSLADASKPAIVLDPVTNREVPLGCINIAGSRTNLLKSEAVEIYKDFNTSLFATGLLVLKPHKEKGQQCVSTDTVAFRIIRGQAIVTLHKASYYLAVGDCFYIPAGNKYNIRNLLNEDSVFLFTQIKDR